MKTSYKSSPLKIKLLSSYRSSPFKNPTFETPYLFRIFNE